MAVFLIVVGLLFESPKARATICDDVNCRLSMVVLDTSSLGNRTSNIIEYHQISSNIDVQINWLRAEAMNQRAHPGGAGSSPAVALQDVISLVSAIFGSCSWARDVVLA